jgi:hypothetical protein
LIHDLEKDSRILINLSSDSANQLQDLKIASFRETRRMQISGVFEGLVSKLIGRTLENFERLIQLRLLRKRVR